MARHIRMRVEGQTPNRLPFHIVRRVLVLDITVGVGIPVEYRVSLRVVFAPAQRIGHHDL